MHNLDNIRQYETHPDLCLERRRQYRNRNLVDIVGGVILVALGVFAFTLTQVAFGIW